MYCLRAEAEKKLSVKALNLGADGYVEQERFNQKRFTYELAHAISKAVRR